MKTTILDLGQINSIRQPIRGNRTLNLYPYRENVSLPEGFQDWQSVIDHIMSLVPVDANSSNEHLITIDSKFFAEDSALRREGLHIDGNFCADPEFQITGKKTWGGTEVVVTWGRTMYEALENGNYNIETPFINEFGIKPEIGKYVSEDLGGIFSVSDLAGCEAFEGEMDFDVASAGDVEHARKQIEAQGTKRLLDANTLYFMTSNTPHESMVIKAGNRRTLIRITLAHDYPNRLVLDNVLEAQE